MDDCLINLRILSQVQEGDKLKCAGQFFEIESGLFSTLYRWLRQDTRERTLSRVSEVMECARALNQPELVAQACEGLTKLRTTYQACPTTVARIDQVVASCRPSLACAAASKEKAPPRTSVAVQTQVAQEQSF